MPWNTQRSDDQRIEVCDLRVGDVLVAMSFGDSKDDEIEWFDPWNMERRYIGPSKEPHTVRVVDSDDGLEHECTLTSRMRPAQYIWIRARTVKVTYKNDTRWNGKCRCGANTYTSSLFVEHEGKDCRS